MLDIERMFGYGFFLPRDWNEVAVLHPSHSAPPWAVLDDDPHTRAVDAAYRAMAEAQLELLRAISRVDAHGSWRHDGARDVGHWVAMRFGMSGWKAHRWVGAARAIEHLPRLALALASGELGIDAVVELARFATSDTEARLIAWARGVSPAAVRRRADREIRRDREAIDQAERGRFLDWWYTDDGRRVGLHGELPADSGEIVVRALESVAAQVPTLPDEGGDLFDAARRADALVAICEGAAESASGHDQAGAERAVGRSKYGRPTLLIHTTLETLLDGAGGGEVDGGPVLDSATVQRLACDAKLQVALEDAGGNPFRLGRLRREPSVAMLRALRYRDRECRFPGCGATRFTDAHHIVWWSRGGTTDLENLLLLCSFHHRLVHERGWGVKRNPDGQVRWFRPDGVRYRAGPAPPFDATPTTGPTCERDDRGSRALAPTG